MTVALSMDRLTVRRGRRTVLDQATLSIHVGELVGLIGPNGAGKTTLMRAALGLLPATSGHSSLTPLTAADRARQAAWLPQSREIVWPVTVETVVALGRIPHLPRGRALAAPDRKAVDEALHQMGLSDIRHGIATELSGGEQARVLIARTLAQKAPLLIADEPAAGLDPGAQISAMQVFSQIASCGGSVLVSMHDLGLAARHCDRLVLMDSGRIVANGPPDEVLTPALLKRVFGISAHYKRTEDGPVFQALEIAE